MKTSLLTLTLLATTIAHAGVESGDESTGKAANAEAMETAQVQIEASRAEAQAEMEAARAQMDAAQTELRAAAKRMAEVSRQQLMSAKQRAFLGVLIGEHSEDGIVVAGVTPAGGAETAGIEAADIIVAINGESLTGHGHPLEALYRVLDEVKPGGEVKLAISRDGDIATRDVATTPSFIRIEDRGTGALRRLGRVVEEIHGHIPQAIVTAAPVVPARPWLDLISPPGATGQLHLVDIGNDLGDYFGVDAGVLVLNAPGKSELKPGDIVRRIDGADVASATEAHSLLAAAADEETAVEVRRKNRKVDVAVAKGSVSMHPVFHAMPTGKARITIAGPEVEVDVEVEKDDKK